MIKDARLSIRITAELDEWLGKEADTRGLDKAAFARMALFERMNGLAKPAFIPPLVTATPNGKGSLPASLPAFTTPAPPIHAESDELEYPFDADEEAIDIDAIVAQRVAEELARRPAASEPYHEGSLGMTAHRRAQAPIYSSLGTSPRIQRQSVWTTTA